VTLHLIKLAVGAKSVDDVRKWQTARTKQSPPLRHRTRNSPKRAAEILDGGSIYWVIAGVISVRQRIADIREAKQPDGTRCTDLVLHPALVPVRGRLMKPFQGWRYLAASDAPPDEAATGTTSGRLPEKLRRELAALALL
jgi:hypothetical protein